MITNMVFIFPFKQDMTEHEVEQQLEKIRSIIPESSDIKRSHMVGLRGCTMTNHAVIGWQELTAEDVNDFPSVFTENTDPDVRP